MKNSKLKKIQFLTFLIVSIFITSCNEKIGNKALESNQTDISTLEKEIELRLREYERHLLNGDSIALGNMYTEDAEIIPSRVGREDIISAFGNLIRDSISGSFNTTKIWGNDQLIVEDGTGTWNYPNGEVYSSGRYLLIWKKDDGEWKILRDTWFAD
ncbi:YybH family protein [Algoriphagus aquimarinus]|uniref:Nuclear transport factor 2 family protein n=1 Tax=Algoriphagus aquimarinus TaxID=237018 RepID=A0A5C7AR85_9BACT|nr:nuclear transport factor 2 family protein [Algoriphagus aquimarinus]TXE11208.1 nuclear transport factor 2 family protein [Algoriphagus aquimarinus]